MTGEVPGNIHCLVVCGAENEYVLVGELDACQPLPVDSPDVVEWNDPGASIGKGDLDTVSKDTSGVCEPVSVAYHIEDLLPSRGF